MDILYKGGALLAAQAEGAARLCVAAPLAVLDNALSAVAAASARRRASSAPSSSSSRCPFSGLVGSSASCSGARMAAAANAKAAGTGGSSDNDANPSSCRWVEGRVTHVRRRPARHAFGYDVRLAFLDLDSPPQWFASSSQRRDHLTADEARAAAGTKGRVMLLTLPSAAGYVQNPISVYYCYDVDENDKQPQLRRCIAEVTNTPWGERVSFVFDPRGAAVPKALHVSPFMDMRNVWLLKASDPLSADNVALSVLVDHPELGRYFDAQFVGKVVAGAAPGATNERAGFSALWRFGFLPQRVAVWIYMHAVLLVLKGVKVQPKPAPESYETRAEVALREEKERRRGDEGGATAPIPAAGGSGSFSSWAGRPFVWRPALRWPWNLD